VTNQLTPKPDIEQKAETRLLGLPTILMALLFTVTWIGAVLAYGWGFFDIGNKVLSDPASWGIAPHVIAAFIILGLLPVAFVWMTVVTLGRAAAMSRAANDLARAARRLTNPVTYMGEGTRTIIAELDAEFERLKGEVAAIDQMLNETHQRISGQVSLLKGAGQSAGEQATVLQQHLGAERQALQELARMIGNEGTRISSLLGTASPEPGEKADLGIPLSGGTPADPVVPPAPKPATPPAGDGDSGDDISAPEPPRKLTPIEELSHYIGQHQTARQDANLEPAPAPRPIPKSKESGDAGQGHDRPRLRVPSLHIGIADETGKPAEDPPGAPDASQEPDTSPGDPAEPESGATNTDAISDSTAKGDVPPGRSGLSLSRRLDRARMPVDLRASIDGLHALSIDLNRLLATAPPADLWRRYMNGEREVFTEHLLTWRDAADEVEVETTAASETFQRYAQRFREQFKNTIQLARTSEAGSTAVTELSNSDISLVNDLLQMLDRRTD